MRNFTFMIAIRNILGIRMKQHTRRYWISSVFVLSLVMIAWARCPNGFEMGMSHNPYDWFLCNFNISLEYLRILISFLSKMAIHSSSHR